MIEAICRELIITNGNLYINKGEMKLNKDRQAINSKSLEGKIYGLYEQGYIVWEQVKVLQTIRELGNSAVHEIREPERSDLKVSIIIIENVLELIYEIKETIFHYNNSENN